MIELIKEKMNRIKIGDEVIVRVGKDKGKRGVVMALDRIRDRVKVTGVNVLVKHQKGGIITQEGTVHISNVMPYDTKSGLGSRVKFDIVDGKKVRVLVKSGQAMSERAFERSAAAANK